MASVDFKETSWFGKYGRTIELPNEAELKTIMTHFDGQENFTLESTEKWAIAWGKTISAKYPDIYVESCDDAQIKMQMPLEWMVLNYKTSHLPLGSGRLEKEPVSRIVPADGSCTIFEHIGGYSTATVYVNENWSTALFKRYARMYDRSVKVLSDDEPNHRYCVPAGWLKLSPPSSRTQKHLREHSYT